MNFAPSGGRGAPVLVCEPPWWRVGGYAVVAAAVVAFGLAGDLDRRGQLLVFVVGAGALGLAGRDALLRPTLRADTQAVTVREGVHRKVLPWRDVRRISARSVNRRGLVGLRSLELDVVVPDGKGGQRDHLVVLSRRMLGADPRTVAEGLERLRVRAGHAGNGARWGDGAGDRAGDRAGADDALDA